MEQLQGEHSARNKELEELQGQHSAKAQEFEEGMKVNEYGLIEEDLGCFDPYNCD